MPKNLKAD